MGKNVNRFQLTATLQDTADLSDSVLRRIQHKNCGKFRRGERWRGVQNTVDECLPVLNSTVNDDEPP